MVKNRQKRANVIKVWSLSEIILKKSQALRYISFFVMIVRKNECKLQKTVFCISRNSNLDSFFTYWHDEKKITFKLGTSLLVSKGVIQQLRGHNFAIVWPLPLHLVHVVIEWPLTSNEGNQRPKYLQMKYLWWKIGYGKTSLHISHHDLKFNVYFL